MDISEFKKLTKRGDCVYIALIEECEYESLYKIGKITSGKKVKTSDMLEIVQVFKSSLHHAIHVILNEYAISLGENTCNYIRTEDIYKYIALAEYISDTYEAYRSVNKKKLNIATLSEDKISIIEKCINTIKSRDYR